MEYQEYENFVSQAHREEIEHYSEEQHLQEIKLYEKSIVELLDEIKKFRSRGEYGQACIWCSFLKTVDRKMNNHLSDLFNMQEAQVGGNSEKL